MYKVFFNDRVITLTDKLSKDDFNKYQLIHSYRNKKLLKEAKNRFEESEIQNMAVLHPDISFLKGTFFELFETIYAAGGLVLNVPNEILMIYRREKWDLPKGKAEKGESMEETAVREVCEETGISTISLTEKICHTYHTYKIGKRDIIKDTAWYLMKSEDDSDLVPQAKEDITEAKWVKDADVEKLLQNSFGTIREVFLSSGILE